MSQMPTHKIALLIPVLTGVVGFFGGRQFSASSVLPADLPSVHPSGPGPVVSKQGKLELDAEYAAWATQVEQSEASWLKEMYDNVNVAFPQAGPTRLAAARAFVLECWAGKAPQELIKEVFVTEDALMPYEVGTALARWNAPEALKLIDQAMKRQSEDQADSDSEDWDELLQSTAGEWANLNPEALLGMIGTPQPAYLQHGIGCALEVLSKSKAAEAAEKLNTWVQSGQMTSVGQVGHELIAKISRNYYQQNAVAARRWIAAISAAGLKQLAAEAYSLCLAEQEGDALATELTRADTIAITLPYPAPLLESNACRPNASLSAGLNLVTAMATRIEKLLKQNPPRQPSMGDGLGQSSAQYGKTTMTSNIGDRSSLAREFAQSYGMSHGGDLGFWVKFAAEVSALPKDWSAELSNIVGTTLKVAESHWEADPQAALDAIAGLPQACQAAAISRILHGLQKNDPAAVTRVLAAMPAEQLSGLDAAWQLMLALGSSAPTTTFKHVDDLIDQTSEPSPAIEKFVVEHGMGEVAYVRKLMHAGDEASAANWAAALPPARAPGAVGAAVQLWALVDDNAAADWVMALPIGPLRAAGANAMATSLAAYDRDASRAWSAKANEAP
jgi:hypothetical protein